MSRPFPNTLVWLRMDELYENTQFLLKYLPKYYTKVEFQASELQDGRVRSKAKRIKIIKSLNIKDYSNRTKTRILNIFQTHKHTIKSINLSDPTLLPFFPQLSKYTLNAKSFLSWKGFKHLTEINVLTLEFSTILWRSLGHQSHRALRHFEWNFWNHLTMLKNLKHFHLQIYNKFDDQVHNFMNRLNRQTLFLISLKTLTLFLNSLEMNVPNEFSFINIFKQMTALKIHEAAFQTLQCVLKYIDTFQNIRSLSIFKTVKGVDEDEGMVNLEFLQYLQNLPMLKTLDMAWNFSMESCLNHFLKFFTLPKNIRSIKLNFCETRWDTIIPAIKGLDMKKDNPFGNHELCCNFYKNWEQLVQLESLSLCFAEVGNCSLPSLYFIIPLLEGLSKLEMLYYASWYSMETGKKKALDFNFFWQTIQHLKPTLKKVYIESFAISLRNLSTNGESVFSNLEELGLCGYVLGDNHVKDLFKLFRGRSVQISKKFLLEIERLVIDNQDSFIHFLDSLLFAPKSLNLAVNVDSRNIPPNDFIDHVCSKIPLIQKKGLIQLNFSNVAQLNPDQMEALQQLINENQMFQELENESSNKFGQSIRRGLTEQFHHGSPGLGLGNDDFNSNFDSEYTDLSDDDLELDDMSLDDKFEDIDEDL